MKTIASVVGARPQFIKAAPVSRALALSFRELIIHTGQHYDYGMSEVFFLEMNMREPDYNLGIGGGTHAEMTGRMLIDLEKIFIQTHPDCVLVYGDTNSTLAGALAAAKLNIPVAHVEAGLRSFNRGMPEELNRVISDHLSTFLFCPTDFAVANLRKEGLENGVYQIGDVMYDALLYNRRLAAKQSGILQRLELKKGSYALATVHRAANADDPLRLRSILDAFGQLNTSVIFPIHPRTQQMLSAMSLNLPRNVKVISPVGPLDMLLLEENANCILTDSGGIQKEAFLLGVRCITLREETEWVETVSSGWNLLTGIVPGEIRRAFESWFPTGDRPDFYGTGRASEELRQVLARLL
jgi:UDP-GlcNAc3NAcA epimerase